MSAGHPQIAESVGRDAEALKRLALELHANPELGFAEHKAVAAQLTLLRRWGAKVVHPLASMDTAFKAAWGRGEPTVCFLSEYDALPEIGHGCGHNLIAAAALGAGRALAEAMKDDRLSGRVEVIGAPAEETSGGKVTMVERGVFEKVDVALMAHPSIRTTPWLGGTAVQSWVATFAGRAAHAAAAPEKGRNALDAVRLLFNGVDAWRQHLPESARVHGVVTDGGAAPNIIPERAECFFFLRSTDDDVLAEMVRRFKDIARGAAMMTDTTVTLRRKGMAYRAPRINDALNRAWVRAAAEAGLTPVTDAPPGRGSTDFADVSQVVPGAHVYFAVTRGKPASHSSAFAAAAGRPMALKNMLRAAEAMANVGYRYVADEAFRRSVADLFARR